jgi:hypothetical protein
MKIKIDDEYTIESDAASWNLLYKSPTGKVSEKTGEPTFSESVSYHANLAQACSSYLNERPKGSATLKDILERLKDAERAVINACTGITR